MEMYDNDEWALPLTQPVRPTSDQEEYKWARWNPNKRPSKTKENK